MKKLEEYVRSIPDFPEPGIIFRDVTSILQDPDGLHLAVDRLLDMVRDEEFDLVVGPESRGFIFGVPVAYELHKGFVPVRKKGKLPCETISARYDLEYGTAEIEIHKDAIRPGQKVVVIDDLMATGGTMEAIIRLVEELGGEVVKICFVMELAGLRGRERLSRYEVESAIIMRENKNTETAENPALQDSFLLYKERMFGYNGDMEPIIFHVDVNSAFLSWEAVSRLKHQAGATDLRTIPAAVGGDVKNAAELFWPDPFLQNSMESGPERLWQKPGKNVRSWFWCRPVTACTKELPGN